jgi:uncharacterized surface protein with fasciclin (FAS1) repeats
MATQIRPRTVVDAAKSAGQFKTLLQAAEAAQLVDTLQGDGPFTVFAPTDAAFRKLESGTLDTLLKPANRKRLQQLLKYHVVSGRMLAKDVTSKRSIRPLEGEALSVQSSGKTARIGNATISQTDIEAENGVVHVIDNVLIPEGF